MAWNSDIQVAITRLINYFTNNKDLNKISAAGGSKLYADTSTHTELDVKSIYVRENTVIATLTGASNIAGTTVNFLTEFNISGATLIAGDLYMVPNGWKIHTIDLTSGSIIAYS